MRVELSNGNWAELRDFEKEPINNRERNRINRCMGFEIDGSGKPPRGSFADFWDLVMAVAREGVLEWSFDLPLPSTMNGVDPLEGSLGDLSIEDSNIIGEAVQPYVDKLMPDFRPNKDHSSPFGRSSASGGRSKAKK